MASNTDTLREVPIEVSKEIFKDLEAGILKNLVFTGTPNNQAQGKDILGKDDRPCRVESVRVTDGSNSLIFTVASAVLVRHPYRVEYLNSQVMEPTVKVYLGDPVNKSTRSAAQSKVANNRKTKDES